MDACKHIIDLSPYLDGELDAGRRAALDAHLPGCAACRAELGQLRALSGVLAVASQPVLPAKAMWRLHGCVNNWIEEAARAERDAEREADRVERRILRISRILTGVAACVLVAGSLWLVQSRQAISPSHPAMVINKQVEGADGSGLAVSVVGVTDETASAGDGSAELTIGGLVNPTGGSGETIAPSPSGNERAE